MNLNNQFEKLASKITSFAGSTVAFVFAIGLVLGWAVTGPLFHYSETWQLFINTATTIITFVMVFVIQKSQNKDALAMQLKLNELVAAHDKASNRVVNVEDLTEDELKVLQKFYHKLSSLSKTDGEGLQSSHSIEEAMEQHLDKEKALDSEQFGMNSWPHCQWT